LNSFLQEEETLNRLFVEIGSDQRLKNNGKMTDEAAAKQKLEPFRSNLPNNLSI